jgi:hypothetical protein
MLQEEVAPGWITKDQFLQGLGLAWLSAIQPPWSLVQLLVTFGSCLQAKEELVTPTLGKLADAPCLMELWPPLTRESWTHVQMNRQPCQGEYLCH